MRFASCTFLLAMALFLGGATTVLGSWAVPAACPLFLVAAISGAVAMEDRDLADAEGLLPIEPATPDVAVSGEVPALLDAA
ncbi:MAG: hypothetical protein ACJ739_17115 [Acidimicrobiales bacterium]